MLNMNSHASRRSFAVLILAAVLFAMPAPSRASVAISVTIAPPALPVYVQPPCPVEGYIWIPGYWAWGPDGYYWVPGVWVAPPQVGLLWTPGYWAFTGGVYVWHPGYWAPHVGFYGGINYGFGYFGVGFVGGYWAGSVFRYNTAVVHVNTTVIRNVYIDRTVIRNVTVVNRVSYNGPGGVLARPTPQEQMVMRERHFEPTPVQVAHFQAAAHDRTLLASYNHGRPPVTAMDRVNGRRFNEQARFAPEPENRVNERRYEQQQRIGEGIRSGQLTPGEAARLERREQNINRQVNEERRANGGKLTPAERQQINREQNQASRQIYREKHNEKEAPR